MHGSLVFLQVQGFKWRCSVQRGFDGQGVHVVTVNDYLARRDAEWATWPTWPQLLLSIESMLPRKGVFIL